MDKEKGSKKMSLFRFIIYLIKKIKDDDVFMLAAQLAYGLIVAFFPFLIFLMTLISRSPLETESVLRFLATILPNSAYILVESTVIEVLQGTGTGVFSISIIFALWSVSRGMSAVIRGLNKAYGQRESRGYIKLLIISLFATIAFALAIMTVLFFLVLGDIVKGILMHYIPVNHFTIFLWSFIRIAIMVLFVYIVFALLYHYAPSKKLGWMEVMPGAVAGTVGWILSSLVFAFYVNNFANYSRFYGSLGAIFILLTWLYISAVIVLLGGEINAILAREDRI